MSYQAPEDKHAPAIAAAIQKLAEDVHGECKASKVVVYCVFTYDAKVGNGNLKLKMDVSNDASMERTSKDPPQPRGTQVLMAALRKLADIMKRYGR